MAQKTSKSAGWTFKPPRQELNLIQYSSHVDPLDIQTLGEIREQIQDLPIDDWSIFINIIPPIEQLIQQIPYTLLLLEAVFQKCELKKLESGLEFPVRDLCCEQLFCQLVWWTAFSDQSIGTTLRRHTLLYTESQEFQPCIRTLILIMSRQCPHIVKRARDDNFQLVSCLESLGCHGLVNCSSGLIRMTDAVQIEVVKHVEHLKTICNQLKDLSDPKVTTLDPSFESHQRQMSMQLSQIFERLTLNETLEGVLKEAYQNQQMASLLRIVQKRVNSDKFLIGLFNAFARSAPEEFALQQMDPVVAQLILLFNNAYNKLLSMCPCEPLVGTSTASNVSTSPSGTRTSSYSNPNTKIVNDDNEEIRQQNEDLKKEVSNLKKELKLANYTISQLKENFTTHGLVPAPDYPDATEYYNCSSREQISQLVAKFSELFIYSSNDLQLAIAEMPSFENVDGESSIVYRTLITAYNSVLSYIEAKRDSLLNATDQEARINTSDNRLTLDSAIYLYFYREFKSRRGEKMSQEISENIWDELEDYSLLRMCPKFVRFLQKCIDISWDIISGIEKRLRLEYEGNEFDASRHSRNAYSTPTSNRIRQFLWPALVDVNTNRIYLKAVVVT